jgi:hypothetical protein
MMMNEFGVPANEHEMSMMKPHEKMVAESGVESGIWGAIISVGAGLIGASKQAKAAKSAANKQNEATERQFEYDTKAYNMKIDQLKSEHAYRVSETATKRANNENQAAYQDAMNARNYSHQLMIRQREQDSLDAQYEKSNKLYAFKTGYNEQVAAKAEQDEWRKLDEINTEAAFDAQEQRLKHLQEEGQIRALGQAGRSVGKTHQSAAASFGFTIAALNEGLASAGRATQSALQDIKSDKFSADLAAWAEKMSDPGELPMPIQPIQTPRTVYDDPEPLMDFHFGPPPVKGAMVSASAASQAAWGSAIPSIVSGGLNAYNMFK